MWIFTKAQTIWLVSFLLPALCNSLQCHSHPDNIYGVKQLSIHQRIRSPSTIYGFVHLSNDPEWTYEAWELWRWAIDISPFISIRVKVNSSSFSRYLRWSSARAQRGQGQRKPRTNKTSGLSRFNSVYARGNGSCYLLTFKPKVNQYKYNKNLVQTHTQAPHVRIELEEEQFSGDHSTTGRCWGYTRSTNYNNCDYTTGLRLGFTNVKLKPSQNNHTHIITMINITIFGCFYINI